MCLTSQLLYAVGTTPPVLILIAADGDIEFFFEEFEMEKGNRERVS